jgi:hypothetical protein
MTGKEMAGPGMLPVGASRLPQNGGSTMNQWTWASIVIVVVIAGTAASAATVTVPSTDVPKVFVDNDAAGFSSTLIGPSMVITDLNLVFDRLLHTSDADIHGELVSPQGTRVTFLKAFTENGILTPDISRSCLIAL